MDFKEYSDKAFRIALGLLKNGGYAGWRGKVCMDTIKTSYENGLTINDAANSLVDDTLYWDGCFI
jgi:hypothetical protein